MSRIFMIMIVLALGGGGALAASAFRLWPSIAGPRAEVLESPVGHIRSMVADEREATGAAKNGRPLAGLLRAAIRTIP